MSDLGSIRAGDVLPIKTLKVALPNGSGWATYSAPRGRQFVLLLLGDEGADGSDPLDPIAALNKLGWQELKHVVGHKFDGSGWVYLNPDAGEEYSENHPVESGECEDAEQVRRSTCQEDALWRAFQAQFAAREAAALSQEAV